MEWNNFYYKRKLLDILDHAPGEEVETVEIKSFYKKIDGVVWEFRKIGDTPWEGVKTPYGRVPYVYVNDENK